MKKHNKSLLTLFFFILTYVSYSQSVTVVAGGNYTNVAYDQGSGTGVEDSYKDKFGFHLGGYYDYVIKKDKSQELVFETGLLFDSKGSLQDLTELGQDMQNLWSLYYIDVPLYLQYRYRFRNLNKFYIGAGPYVGFGLFGNTITTQKIGENTSEDKVKIKWGNNDSTDDLKRLDYGVSARVGFHFDDGFDISASYDYGIPNIASMGENIKMKSRVLRLSVGYSFSLID